jgi:hypothetical protein
MEPHRVRDEEGKEYSFRYVTPTYHLTNAPAPARHRPRSARTGVAVTRRRATTTRCSCVGTKCADLPSGERAKNQAVGMRHVPDQ